MGIIMEEKNVFGGAHLISCRTNQNVAASILYLNITVATSQGVLRMQ
jgi:hypothetical protein